MRERQKILQNSFPQPLEKFNHPAKFVDEECSMTGKTGNKTGLVLTPQLLIKNIPILELLHISKTATGINYKTEEPDSRAINQSFPHLPKELKEVLLHFSAGYCEKREKAIKEKFKTGRAGMAFSEFFETALLRDWHSLLEINKTLCPSFKFLS
jgi:hypothetical protein